MRATYRRHGLAVRRLAFAVMLLGGVGGCGETARSVDAESADAFAFVRDDAGILAPGQARRAEQELHEIAGRTGVFGVVVTRGADDAIDPPQIYSPIMEEVSARSGEALVTICTPDACGPHAGTAHTDALNDAVEIAGGESHLIARGQRRNVNQGLRDWVDYVAAVAANR